MAGASWRELCDAECETWTLRVGLGSTGEAHGAENASTCDSIPTAVDNERSAGGLFLSAVARRDLCRADLSVHRRGAGTGRCERRCRAQTRRGPAEAAGGT